AVRERGEHDSGLHDDQHVLEAVGGERAGVSAAPRSSDRARARAARRETARPDNHVSVCGPREHGGSPKGTARAGLSRPDGGLKAVWLPLGLALVLFASSATAALTESARLAAVYETILKARFDEVDAQLK